MGQNQSELIEELQPPLAWLTLNRPAQRNAMTLSLWSSLAAAVRRLGTDKTVHAIIIRGAGEQAFSAGADIGEINYVRQSSDRIQAYLEAVESVMASIEDAGKPVIAMVNGAAVGGGCEVAAACDLRVASSHAKFGIPAGNLGIVINANDFRRLTALVGLGRAKDILMTGRLLTAEEALSIGLVNRVVAPERLRAESEALAREISCKAPETARAAKIMGKQMVSGRPAGELAEVLKLSVEGWNSENFAEGVRAYIEGRPPKFPNR